MNTTRKRVTLADKVGGAYGAPMGRANFTTTADGDALYPGISQSDARELDRMKAEPRRFYLQYAPLDSGGYDAGGAYWGSGGRVYLAQSEDAQVFRSFRASDHADALAQLREEWPKAYTFTDARELVRVVFRAFRDGDVIALFPDLPGTNDPRTCASYLHVGQHGSADYRAVIADTRPARVPEYESLRRELESAPFFYDLRVCDARAIRRR